MIKFRIYLKILEGERCKFGEASEKCQNYRFFDIFLDILHKFKGNLDQEHVKRGPLYFQGKNWKNFTCHVWKNYSFFQFCSYFSTRHSLKSGFPT